MSGPRPGDVTHFENLSMIGALILIQIVAFCVLHRLVPKGVENPMAMARDGCMLLVLPGLLYYSFSTTMQLYSTLDDRWFGHCPQGLEFMRLYISTQLFQSFIDLASPGSLSSKIPMLAHHVLSSYCYGSSIFLQRMQFFASFDGNCEATTPFLMVLNLGRTKGGGVEEWVKAKLGPLWVVNGLFLWLTFIVFRLLMFPLWLYVFFKDIYSMPNSSWERLTWNELTVYPVVTLFLLVLSFGWFLRIHAGLMKAVKGMGKKE